MLHLNNSLINTVEHTKTSRSNLHKARNLSNKTQESMGDAHSYNTTGIEGMQHLPTIHDCPECCRCTVRRHNYPDHGEERCKSMFNRLQWGEESSSDMLGEHPSILSPGATKEPSGDVPWFNLSDE